MATFISSRCYCANYYGSINCRNTVPKFGDRCKLCVALKSGASLSENLLPDELLWGIESHTHSHSHSHSRTRNQGQSHSHNRERPSFLVVNRQPHHHSHHSQARQPEQQHPYQRSHRRKEEERGRGEVFAVEESPDGGSRSSSPEKCPRPAGTMAGSSGKRRV